MLGWGFDVTKTSPDIATISVVVLLLIIGIIAVPLFTLLALNTLFPTLSIPYTFGTWLATLWVLAVINGKVKTK
jgi:hypothetical protein